MTWAVRQKVGGVTGKAVLMMLANYADADGMCIPSQARIGRDAECSERTVRAWLDTFEQHGLLTREGRRRDDGYRTSDRIILDLSSDFDLTADARISPEADSAKKSPEDISPENAAAEISPADASDLTGRNCRARTSQGNRKIGGGDARERDDAWDRLKAAFPQRNGSQPWSAGRPKFDAILKTGEDPEALIVGAARCAEEARILGTFGTSKVPHVTTWLNQRRWRDYGPDWTPPQPEIRPARGPPVNGSHPPGQTPGERSLAITAGLVARRKEFHS